MRLILGAIGVVLTVAALLLVALLFWFRSLGLSKKQNQKNYFDDAD